MKRIWIAFLLLLMLIPTAHGITAPTSEVKILDIEQMPVIEYEDFSMELEFEIENTGYEKVLIQFPEEFEVDEDNIDNHLVEGILTIAESRLALRDKYGDPDDSTSFINTHEVTISETPISRGPSIKYKESSDDEGRLAWYIRPNERLKVHIKVETEDDGGSGIIDPFSLEEDLPFIEVTKFSAIIYFEPEEGIFGGFVAAPYVVKYATIVTSYPNIIADANEFDETEYYWHRFKPSEYEETKEINVVDWDEWFTTSSLQLITSSAPLTPTLLTTTDLEYYSIEKAERKEDVRRIEKVGIKAEEEETFVPVFYVDQQIAFVRYEYLWRKGFEISGIYLDYLREPPTVHAPIPEWNDWF